MVNWRKLGGDEDVLCWLTVIARLFAEAISRKECAAICEVASFVAMTRGGAICKVVVGYILQWPVAILVGGVFTLAHLDLVVVVFLVLRFIEDGFHIHVFFAHQALLHFVAGFGGFPCFVHLLLKIEHNTTGFCQLAGGKVQVVFHPFGFTFCSQFARPAWLGKGRGSR